MPYLQKQGTTKQRLCIFNLEQRIVIRSERHAIHMRSIRFTNGDNNYNVIREKTPGPN